jgi:kinesin family member 5
VFWIISKHADCEVVNGEDIFEKKMRAFLDFYKDNLKCLIKHGEIQGNYISGATEISILNSSDALENLFPGIVNRAVGKTQTNLASSRNLCLYIFSVQYRSTSDKRVPSGKIILINLDGSVTIKKIGAEGRGLADAKAINNVIDSLSFVLICLSA